MTNSFTFVFYIALDYTKRSLFNILDIFQSNIKLVWRLFLVKTRHIIFHSLINKKCQIINSWNQNSSNLLVYNSTDYSSKVNEYTTSSKNKRVYQFFYPNRKNATSRMSYRNKQQIYIINGRFNSASINEYTTSSKKQERLSKLYISITKK